MTSRIPTILLYMHIQGIQLLVFHSIVDLITAVACTPHRRRSPMHNLASFPRHCPISCFETVVEIESNWNLWVEVHVCMHGLNCKFNYGTWLLEFFKC